MSTIFIVDIAQKKLKYQTRKEKTMKLSDLFDCSQLVQEIHDNFVRVASHPTDTSKKILCYTEHAQYNRHWNDITRNCRGLAIQLDSTKPGFANAHILSRGIPKFFTLSNADATDDNNFMLNIEDDDEGVAQLQGIKVNLSCPVHAADKLDGAMAVGYLDHDILRVHTKGSFASEEAQIANHILNKKYSPHCMGKWITTYASSYTPIFEIITPRFPHIVDYGLTEDLFLLGWVEIATGKWIPVTPDNEFALIFKLNTPKTILDGTFEEMLKLKPRQGKEGIVVTFDTTPQRMIKVKYDEFLRMQRLRNAIRKSDLAMIAENLLVITMDWTHPLEPNDDLLRLSPGLKRQAVGLDRTDETVPLRIIEPAIFASLDLVIETKPEFDKAYAEVLYIWGIANGYRLSGLEADESFVQATLRHAKPKYRNTVFYTKRHYLEVTSDTVRTTRAQIAHIVAHGIIKHYLKTH